MTFRGSLYYWFPRMLPILPAYSQPFGMPSVSLTITDTRLAISAPWPLLPFLCRGWNGPLSDIERVDVTWLGLRFWFKGEPPMIFRTNQRDILVRALKQRDVQIGVKEREVG